MKNAAILPFSAAGSFQFPFPTPPRARCLDIPKKNLPSPFPYFIAINRNADVPRALVRDMYTKSWSAFDRLVAIVPPGGSIG